MSEVAKEKFFLRQVVVFIGYTMKFPIVIKIGNSGVFSFSSNHTTTGSQVAQHIDIPQHLYTNSMKPVF
jgi:kynurenine formamidase